MQKCGRVKGRRATHREEAGVKVQQGHEHEHQEDTSTQLHVLLWGALAHGGHPREHALPLRAGLRQQEEQTPAQGQVPGGTGVEREGLR